MIIFRFSVLALALLIGACGTVMFKPKNDLEALLQGNVSDVIASLERYIFDHEGDPEKLEADLLAAGFKKSEFVAKLTEFEIERKNCQFYRYRRKWSLSGFGAAATVWLCEKGSGANFGYIAP